MIILNKGEEKYISQLRIDFAYIQVVSQYPLYQLVITSGWATALRISGTALGPQRRLR